MTVSLDPGWVRTDMGGPQASLIPQQAVEGMIRLIDQLIRQHNARFLSWRGGKVPW